LSKSLHNGGMGDLNRVESPVRVLVIEDNEDDRELLQRQLRKSGMDQHVRFISDGREALDFLTGPQSPSLTQSLIAVLLDLKLPSLSGLDLLRRMRARDELKTTPVIVMTSSNDPEDLEECRKLRVLNYVSKPVTFSAFSKAVADVFHLPSFHSDSSPRIYPIT
jgi:CheY-like chemotaxis protein